MTQSIELELDDLDAQKVEKLNDKIGEEPVKESLSQALTDVVREMYDNRDQIQEQRRQAQQEP